MAANGAQYVLLEGLGVADALAAHLRLQRGSARTTERTFYDTFDGRLHAEGLALVHADGRLAAVDSITYDERAAADRPDPPDRMPAGELPAGPLRDLLLPIVEVRALLPTVRIRSRLRPLCVLDDEAKTVVRLIVETPTVLADGRARKRLQPRLHVAAVRGYRDELAEVSRRLEDEIGVTAADAPLQDEAVAAAGGIPAGISSKPRFALRADQPAAVAAATVFSELLRVIEANVPGTLADIDSEFLHDLRVAVRRTRSLQRQLKSVLDPEPLARFRAEFRWLQQRTGPARDLDVYVLDFDSFREHAGPDIEPLRSVLEQRRAREHAFMARSLRSARTRRLLAGWAEFLEGLDGGPPIGEVASARIDKVYRRMVKAGGAIDDGSPPEALHDLRKQGKELRYLLEFFSDLYPADVVKPMVKKLKSLQDTLGRFQDREVQAATLRAMREDVAGLPEGPAALMAMGLLVQYLERDQAAARAEFAERFGAFAAKRRRALMRKTFR